MNPSTALARVLVDELVRGGVRDAVVAPGSRSAPVALAFAAAERAGELRLHVRIDERTASFLALGLAKASGRPEALARPSARKAAVRSSMRTCSRSRPSRSAAARASATGAER